MLTQSLLKELVNYDPKTGIMIWKKRKLHHFKNHSYLNVFNSQFAGKMVGSVCNYGYLQTTISVSSLDITINTKVHRLAWFYMYGSFPIGIDHINGNPLDNRLINLREADQELNNKNLKKPSHNTSGLAGVHFDKSRNKWQVQVKIKGKRVFCKRYSCLLDAAAALFSFRKNNGFSIRHGR